MIIFLSEVLPFVAYTLLALVFIVHVKIANETEWFKVFTLYAVSFGIFLSIGFQTHFLPTIDDEIHAKVFFYFMRIVGQSLQLYAGCTFLKIYRREANTERPQWKVSTSSPT